MYGTHTHTLHTPVSATHLNLQNIRKSLSDENVRVDVSMAIGDNNGDVYILTASDRISNLYGNLFVLEFMVSNVRWRLPLEKVHASH